MKGKPQFRGQPPRFVGYDPFAGTKLEGQAHRWGEAELRAIAKWIQEAQSNMPTFTAKHYDQLAKAIKSARADNHKDTHEAGVNSVLNALLVAFRADNPRFKDFTFIESTHEQPTHSTPSDA